jgi:hypothetical protein
MPAYRVNFWYDRFVEYRSTSEGQWQALASELSGSGG